MHLPTDHEPGPKRRASPRRIKSSASSIVIAAAFHKPKLASADGGGAGGLSPVACHSHETASVGTNKLRPTNSTIKNTAQANHRCDRRQRVSSDGCSTSGPRSRRHNDQ